jgi:hypothetical protein
MDLTKIDRPFGELDRETKVALLSAWVDGAQIQFKGFNIASPQWHPHYVYRVVVTKPSIDWSHVAPQFKWMATSKSGLTWLFEADPYLGQAMWCTNTGRCINADTFASFRAGTCDWKDSLVQRPEEM